MSRQSYIKYPQWLALGCEIGKVEEMEDFHILLYTLLYYFKFIDGVIYFCNFFYLCNFLTCQKKKTKEAYPHVMTRESLQVGSKVIQFVPPTNAGNCYYHTVKAHSVSTAHFLGQDFMSKLFHFLYNSEC